MGLIKYFKLKETYEIEKTLKRILFWHDINKIPECHKNIILFLNSDNYEIYKFDEYVNFQKWVNFLAKKNIPFNEVIKWAYLD